LADLAFEEYILTILVFQMMEFAASAQ